MRHCLILLLGLLLISPVAEAKKLVVKKGTDLPTIQSGVDAATAGDRIVVKSGVYQENVVIPSTHTGLTLKASGQVTIEARAAGGVGAGPAVRIECADVTVQGFTIQNAATDPSPPNDPGCGILTTESSLTVRQVMFRDNAAAAIWAPQGDGTHVQDCVFLGNRSALNITGDDVIVTGLRVANSDQSALIIAGGSASITSCDVSNCGGTAFDITGPSCLVFKNTVNLAGGHGVVVDGNWAKIRDNKLCDLGSDAISVVGDYADVNDNQIEQTAGGTGVFLDGNNHSVRGNRIRRTRSHCIHVVGENASIHDNNVSHPTAGSGIVADGDNPLVTENRVAHVMGDHTGITMQNAVTVGLLDGNSVDNVTDAGIEVAVTCLDVTIRGNTVTRAGNNHEDGFSILGDGHVLRNNTASNNGGDGFNITGIDILLRGNTATENGRDGFDIEGGSSVSILENRAEGNAAEGIENNATGTIIADNFSKQNRIDYANSGTVQSFTGNASGDGSDDTTLPEID
ncbi:MAG: right-handed parallel beta-helix repeat-containing protein [Planctomycetota bacterium]